MKKILRDRGYRATPARLAILAIFAKNRIPLNAETVYQKIQRTKRLGSVNEATVYRTLSALVAGRILKLINLRQDSLYYELERDHHHHIVCTACQRIEDFHHPRLEKIITQIARQSAQFQNVSDHSLELFGLCRACA